MVSGRVGADNAAMIDKLEFLIALAHERHFGRAARRLEMLPSALSRDIRLLETSLGTRLLLRTTRNVMLSQDGAAFVDDARALVTRAIAEPETKNQVSTCCRDRR